MTDPPIEDVARFRVKVLAVEVGDVPKWYWGPPLMANQTDDRLWFGPCDAIRSTHVKEFVVVDECNRLVARGTNEDLLCTGDTISFSFEYKGMSST